MKIYLPKGGLRTITGLLLLMTVGLTACQPIQAEGRNPVTNSTQNVQSGYAAVNGLQMYYEIHGMARAGQPPLVLLHGALSAIGTSFDNILPHLAQNHQVIAFELQGHGRTADIDRPMSVEAMADDVAAALPQLGFEQADLFGYSMGAAVALQVAIDHPEVVRKLVFMSATYSMDGFHPGLMEGLGEMSPEMMYGSPWHEEYLRIAPNPENFDTLFTKKTEMDQQFKDVPEETIGALTAPTLIIIGDSDIARPEHAVAMFRLFGGGVFGDMPPGLPNSQLAVLPGTSHISMLERGAWLAPMIRDFLAKPMPETSS